MTTTTTRRGRASRTAAAVGSRAVLAAVLAAVVTFVPSADRHDAVFGLAVFGGYLIAQGALLAVLNRALALSRTGRGLVLARAAVSLVGGVVALAGLQRGLPLLQPLEAIVFLALGALEVAGGLRRTELPELAGDSIVVGGLQLLVGAMLVILNADALFSVGVLAAWGAVVAVYLGISSVNLARRGRSA